MPHVRPLVLSFIVSACTSVLPTELWADSTPGMADLAAVAPKIACSALAKETLTGTVGATTSIDAHAVETAKGQFCHVTGEIAPSIGFEVDLPIRGWTQRFLQAGCGGLCGSINASIGNAGDCRPALDGHFVVAASDLGHKGHMGSPDEGAFAADPQKRIDFAYRANHLTAVAAKALIAAYYGQPPRYAYFSGCSDGGREALMEAQRYPGDFDGISAGAPAMMFQLQNSFWHGWTAAANTRPDGRHILLAAKLPVLHAAVIQHCDMLDGTADGLLSDPRACKVDSAWVLCPTATTDTRECLTADEWAVAAKIYTGPVDDADNRFLPAGAMPGSEMGWGSFVPQAPDGRQMSAGMLAAMAPVVFTDPSKADETTLSYPFDAAQFARVAALHPLNDATDPDLSLFARRGGKLILWHGWSDESIAPMMSVAYYEAVRKQMGDAPTDAFLRLFMIPGVGHCGGGDGFAQFDTLSALMAWTETARAPNAIVADKIVDRRTGPPGQGRGVPANGADGRSHAAGPGDAARPIAPYAQPDEPALARRPIYPFPTIARYTGKGDPARAQSYDPAPSPAGDLAISDWIGSQLMVSAFMRDYRVEAGALQSTPRR